MPDDSIETSGYWAEAPEYGTVEAKLARLRAGSAKAVQARRLAEAEKGMRIRAIQDRALARTTRGEG